MSRISRFIQFVSRFGGDPRLRIVAGFALLGIATISPAATPGVPGEYSRARLVTTEGKRIEALRVSVGSDSLKYQEKGAGMRGDARARSALGIGSVRYLEVQTGTRAASYGLIGLGVGALGALTGVLQAQSDPNVGTAGANVGLIVGGIAAASGVIGALVGAASPVYTPVRKNSAWIDQSPDARKPPPRQVERRAGAGGVDPVDATGPAGRAGSIDPARSIDPIDPPAASRHTGGRAATIRLLALSVKL